MGIFAITDGPIEVVDFWNNHGFPVSSTAFAMDTIKDSIFIKKWEEYLALSRRSSLQSSHFLLYIIQTRNE